MRDLSTISELRDSLERHLKHDTLSADVILQELSSLELRRRWALSVILDLQQALLSQGHKHDRILATAYLTLGAVEAKQTWALLDTQWRCLILERRIQAAANDPTIAYSHKLDEIFGSGVIPYRGQATKNDLKRLHALKEYCGAHLDEMADAVVESSEDLNDLRKATLHWVRIIALRCKHVEDLHLRIQSPSNRGDLDGQPEKQVSQELDLSRESAPRAATTQVRAPQTSRISTKHPREASDTVEAAPRKSPRIEETPEGTHSHEDLPDTVAAGTTLDSLPAAPGVPAVDSRQTRTVSRVQDDPSPESDALRDVLNPFRSSTQAASNESAVDDVAMLQPKSQAELEAAALSQTSRIRSRHDTSSSAGDNFETAFQYQSQVAKDSETSQDAVQEQPAIDRSSFGPSVELEVSSSREAEVHGRRGELSGTFEAAHAASKSHALLPLDPAPRPASYTSGQTSLTRREVPPGAATAVAVRSHSSAETPVSPAIELNEPKVMGNRESEGAIEASLPAPAPGRSAGASTERPELHAIELESGSPAPASASVDTINQMSPQIEPTPVSVAPETTNKLTIALSQISTSSPEASSESRTNPTRLTFANVIEKFPPKDRRSPSPMEFPATQPPQEIMPRTFLDKLGAAARQNDNQLTAKSAERKRREEARKKAALFAERAAARRDREAKLKLRAQAEGPKEVGPTAKASKTSVQAVTTGFELEIEASAPESGVRAESSAEAPRGTRREAEGHTLGALATSEKAAGEKSAGQEKLAEPSMAADARVREEDAPTKRSEIVESGQTSSYESSGPFESSLDGLSQAPPAGQTITIRSPVVPVYDPNSQITVSSNEELSLTHVSDPGSPPPAQQTVPPITSRSLDPDLTASQPSSSISESPYLIQAMVLETSSGEIATEVPSYHLEDRDMDSSLAQDPPSPLSQDELHEADLTRLSDVKFLASQELDGDHAMADIRFDSDDDDV